MTFSAETAWLPDVNFWLALVADRHEHHQLASEWFSRLADPLFFCRVTQMGLLRLLTNNKVMAEEVLSPKQALSVYQQLLADERIEFVNEPDDLEILWTAFMGMSSASRNSWTDAYLAAFAVKAGLSMVSFDKGLRQWPSLQLDLLSSRPH